MQHEGLQEGWEVPAGIVTPEGEPAEVVLTFIEGVPGEGGDTMYCLELRVHVCDKDSMTKFTRDGRIKQDSS